MKRRNPFGPPPVWLAWGMALFSVLLLLGLPALYTSQRQSGWLGLIGVILFFLAYLVLGVGENVVAAIAFSGPPQPAPTGPITPPPAVIIGFLAGAIMLLIGSILLALGILRAHVFPRWTAWALIASAILLVVAFFAPGAPAGAIPAIVSAVSTLLSAAALVWIGYMLARPASAISAQLEEAQRG
ncbi:MAG: hypothetical protein E6I80_27425 [Chloroflexi bacterium]|nr:MAG: hypothetical protein E6I80_27425 [Chloroflexota bacterium]